MTEATTLKPDKNCSELFNILARHGLESVVVEFSGGSKYDEHQGTTAYKDGKEVDVEEVMIENEKLFGEKQCDEDFAKYEDLIHVWHNVADTMSWGYDEYDRYDEGKYYNGTEDNGQVIFDVAKREIRLEAQANVRVLEYRYDNVSKVCVVKDDGSLIIQEEATGE